MSFAVEDDGGLPLAAATKQKSQHSCQCGNGNDADHDPDFHHSLRALRGFEMSDLKLAMVGDTPVLITARASQ